MRLIDADKIMKKLIECRKILKEKYDPNEEDYWDMLSLIQGAEIYIKSLPTIKNKES